MAQVPTRKLGVVAATSAGEVAKSKALLMVKLFQRRWFGGRFRPEVERYMISLLVSAITAQEAGTPLTKKAAVAAMGVEDVKTARKYVQLAEREGLLEASPSPDDKRKELLYPTPRLWELLHKECELVAMLLEPARGVALSLLYHASGDDRADAEFAQMFKATIASCLEEDRQTARAKRVYLEGKKYEQRSFAVIAGTLYRVALVLDPGLEAARAALERLPEEFRSTVESEDITGLVGTLLMSSHEVGESRD